MKTHHIQARMKDGIIRCTEVAGGPPFDGSVNLYRLEIPGHHLWTDLGMNETGELTMYAVCDSCDVDWIFIKAMEMAYSTPLQRWCDNVTTLFQEAELSCQISQKQKRGTICSSQTL